MDSDSLIKLAMEVGYEGVGTCRAARKLPRLGWRARLSWSRKTLPGQGAIGVSELSPMQGDSSWLEVSLG